MIGLDLSELSEDPLFLVSVNLFAAVLLRCIRPNVFSALILTVVMIASTVYLGAKQGEPILSAIYQARDQVLTTFESQTVWPPEQQRRYPDLALRDHAGRLVKLSEFQGKVILIEPIGMSCPACVAFSGGKKASAFRGIRPQTNLDSIDSYAQSFGNVDLDDPDLIFLQIILFNDKFEAPTTDEVAAWRNHFGKSRGSNYVVLGGTPELAIAASQALIPGFQLVDKNFVLRMDSTGEVPADDLYLELLPNIRKLLEQ